MGHTNRRRLFIIMNILAAITTLITIIGSAAYSETLIKCLHDREDKYDWVFLIDDAKKELFLGVLKVMNGEYDGEPYGNSYEESVEYLRRKGSEDILFWNQDLILFTQVKYFGKNNRTKVNNHFLASVYALDRAKGTISSAWLSNAFYDKQMKSASHVENYKCQIWNGKNNKF